MRPPGATLARSLLTHPAAPLPTPRFTTLTAIPGTLHYKGARIQIVDLPGIIEGAKDGKGRGRQVIGTARTCELILIVLDASKPVTQKKIMERELEGFGIRLNKKPPNLIFSRKDKGGITYRNVAGSPLDEESVKNICAEYRIHNADVTNREPGATVDDLIDVIENSQRAGRVVYIPCLYVLNKIDSITIEELDLLDRVPHYVMISAKDKWGLDDLMDKMWAYMSLVRVYTKPKGQVPDYSAPVICKTEKRSIENMCDLIHKQFAKQLKYAWVWGASVRHQPQRVGKEHLLEDEDVVQLVKRI